MKLGQDLLYLSDADVRAAGLGLAEVEAAVEAVLAAKAAGSAMMKPKLSLHAPGHAGGGTVFLASAGVLGEPAYGGVKWVGVADAQKSGLPHIAGTVLLNDAATGMPVAILDARWITGVRTAAITAVAARRLARPESARIGFVACGIQARAHLAALKLHFPLATLRAYSRRLSTAQAFAQEAGAEGLAAEAIEDPRDAVAGMDIVITSTPVVPPTPPASRANAGGVSGSERKHKR